ncbi:MAG TPA: cytochrome P450 [Acidobacteriaceae bacterium]|nr:cytochrome P450 [Acidobacteriaceae bacterium]
MSSREMISTHGRIPVGPTEKYNPSHDLLTWLSDNFKQFGDVYLASIYGDDVYVVSDPHYADYILRANWQNYKKGQAIKRVGMLLGNGLMVSEGEFWKSQRQMIQPAFHDKAIGALNDIIRTANVALLKKWEQAAREAQSVNVTSDISMMILSIVLRSIFGDDYEQVASQFGILSDESARNLQFAQTFRPLGNLIIEVAAQRRSRNMPGTDFLGMLMEARDRHSGRRMSDRQLVNEILTLIVAGHETTASTLNWTWYLLAQNPGAEEKLSKELNTLLSNEFPELCDLPKFTYTRHVIEEALRLYPAGWLMTRKALKDDQLGDYFVPAGTEVYISPYIIQRHPALWDDPDSFNPDRFENVQAQERRAMKMIPFSAGPRKCIGELLARIEMQIHLMTIAKHLRLRCISADPVELDIGVNLRNKNDFIMTPEIKGTSSSRFDHELVNQ